MRVCLCLVFLCSLVLTGCSNNPESKQTGPLRIGVLPVLDTLPLQVAAHEGLFEEQGLQVELIPFASAHERDIAMQSGELDGYFGDMLIALLMMDKGVDMRMAITCYATTRGQRMFGIVTAPGVDFKKSMTVGISKTTIIEYLLDRMQTLPEINGLELTRVEIKKIPIRLQMLLSGQIDAALLPEPLLTLAESKGGKVLVTDETLDMPLTVICLRTDKLHLLEPFRSAYSQAVQRINDKPEEFRVVMAATTRIPDPLVASFPIYEYPAPRLPAEQDVLDMQEWMLSQDMIEKPMDYGSVVP